MYTSSELKSKPFRVNVFFFLVPFFRYNTTHVIHSRARTREAKFARLLCDDTCVQLTGRENKKIRNFRESVFLFCSLFFARFYIVIPVHVQAV